jgi:hypothetical protein
MATDFSVEDLVAKCASLRVTLPELRNSLQHANIEWEGHQSAPVFTTKPLKIAGYGISIAKMGDPFPLQPSDKLKLPIQMHKKIEPTDEPDDELLVALREVTNAVAREIEKNKDKVRQMFASLAL